MEQYFWFMGWTFLVLFSLGVVCTISAGRSQDKNKKRGS